MARVLRRVIGIAALAAGLALIGYVTTLFGGDKLVPLVKRSDWQVSGQFFNPKWPPDDLQLPAEMLKSRQLVLWRSSDPETGIATTGRVTSGAFKLPRFIAIPHYGFPGDTPENRIFLRCIGDGNELEVATLRTNTRWGTAYMRIPAGFCPDRKAELVAVAVLANFNVGIGTPFKLDIALFLAQTSFVPRAMIVVGTWALFAALFAVFAYIANRRNWGDTKSMGAGFAGIGSLGMVAILAFMIAPAIGQLATILMVVLGIGGSVGIWLVDRGAMIRITATHGRPLLMWLLLALACAAFASIPDSGGGSWAFNGLFTPLRWSSDNQIPFTLGEALYNGIDPNKLNWWRWLASDRTPLLSGLLLILRAPLIGPLTNGIGSTFLPTAYLIAGITILASWIVVVYHFAYKYYPRYLPLIVLIAAISPFCFFNTIYTWPKIIGGLYVFVAFLLLHELSRRQDRDGVLLTMVALSAVLAYLSHASNAFALLPIALLYARTIFRQGAVAIGVATVAAIAVDLPWLYWQIEIQPNGNALIRYALTGDFGFEDRERPILESVRDAYARLGLDGWLEMKRKALEILSGVEISPQVMPEIARHSPGSGWKGDSRILDALTLARTLGIALVGLAVLLVHRLRGSGSSVHELRTAFAAAAAGLAGIVFTVIVTLIAPIVPTLPYGSILLLLVAGGVGVASLGSIWAWALTGLYAVYFAVVWILPPIAIGLRLDLAALIAFIAAIVLLVFTCVRAATLTPSVQIPGPSA